MRRRRGVSASGLTSFLDVLFILVFAAVANTVFQSAGAEEAEAADAPAPVPAEMRAARDRAVDAHVRELEGRVPLIARVSAAGRLTQIERGAAEIIAVDELLVTAVDDPDVALVYRGAADPALSLCALILARVDRAEFERSLLIVALDRSLGELSVALALGLRGEQRFCYREYGVPVLLLDPRDQ